MTSRYRSREIKVNANELYKESLKVRSRKLVRQYTTPVFDTPSVDDLEDITVINHVWSMGDKYYKLAHHHYGDSELWWVIAWYNNAPTESHLKLGDVIFIPSPLERLLTYYGV
jgi:nucleoid-associated protein YgaU|tara:strand:- start:189 stop:527 length:339 start_codon:yes stop_codon:yes gene_type:complete